MADFSKTYPGKPWRIFVPPQSRTQLDQSQNFSQTLLSHCPPNDLPCKWWCYQSFLTTESTLGSIVWSVRPSNTYGTLRALQAILEARLQMSQRKSRRSLWKRTYSSTFPLSISCCDSLLSQIPEFFFRTTPQFISSQVSNILLALPNLSLKMLPVLGTEPFFGSRSTVLGSEVKVFQQTPIILALSAVTCLRRSKSHLKQYGWVLEPGFHTLRKSR